MRADLRERERGVESIALCGGSIAPCLSSFPVGALQTEEASSVVSRVFGYMMRSELCCTREGCGHRCDPIVFTDARWC